MGKILMIDDDPAMVEMVQELLEGHGHLVLKATKSEQAIKLFQETRPELVIIDIIMPGVDGFELLRQFKETAIDFKSILLSGISDNKSRQLSQEIGADLYLIKPVPPERFEKIIQDLLGQSH